jgi:hypothetical protein
MEEQDAAAEGEQQGGLAAEMSGEALEDGDAVQAAASPDSGVQVRHLTHVFPLSVLLQGRPFASR